jgi:uncharacterized protein YjiS (DUF1127 family)
MTAYARRARMDQGRGSAVGPAGMLRTAAARLLLGLLDRLELARQRRQLLAMDDRMLKDIGVTRADALREGARPFWDHRGVAWTQWR